MRTLRALAVRLSNLFSRSLRERELADELESHLALHIDDNLRAGMSPADARRQALLKLGGLEPAKEACRDRQRLPLFEALARDLRYAIRALRKTPAFTATVVLTLALGIGANTAIFSVLHAAFAPLAIPDAGRVVMVWTEDPHRNWHQFPASVPDYRDWASSGIFTSLCGFNNEGFNLRFPQNTERIDGVLMTPSCFAALAPRPQLGRLFSPGDAEPGRTSVVLLGDALWRSRFSSDPSIVGRSLIVNGSPHTVIGVLPSNFPKLGTEQLFLPLAFDSAQLSRRGERYLGVLGRLAPGLSLAAAQSRISTVSARQAAAYREDAGQTVVLQPIQEAFVQDSRALLLILFAAVGFVLLIACANIASLLLARGTVRGREFAIRAALGAGRWCLARQLLVESVLLAIVGGVIAILPALGAIRFIASFHLEELPNPDQATLDLGVLAFNFVLALATGVLFGLVPAWQAWGTSVGAALNAGGRANTAGPRQRVRGVFVVAEMAFALVLLIGAGLMLRSFLRLRASDPGYRAAGVLTLRIALSDRLASDPVRTTAFYNEVLARTRTIPGVRTVAAIDELPTGSDIHGAGLFFPDRPEPRTEDIPIVIRSSIAGEYFQAMRIPLLRGRTFTDADRKDGRLVAVIDEYTARHNWPHQDAVGKLIKLGNHQPTREIVGVVGDVEQPVLVKLVKGQLGQVYLPLTQEPRAAMSLVLYAAGDPAALAPEVRNIVRSIDVDQPVFRIETMEAARAAGHLTQQLAAWLLGAFAVLGLLLAAIGIYGLIAFSVTRRSREFGIRMSLGATRANVLALVVRQGLGLAAVGIILGLAGALALTRLMTSLLYGIAPTDPLTFGAVTAILAAAALLASYLPARRATKVDPSLALRCE